MDQFPIAWQQQLSIVAILVLRVVLLTNCLLGIDLSRLHIQLLVESKDLSAVLRYTSYTPLLRRSDEMLDVALCRLYSFTSGGWVRFVCSVVRFV
jgi:hypothetical protein